MITDNVIKYLKMTYLCVIESEYLYVGLSYMYVQQCMYQEMGGEIRALPHHFTIHGNSQSAHTSKLSMTSFSDMNANSPSMCLTVVTGARAKKDLICLASVWLTVNPANPITVP